MMKENRKEKIAILSLRNSLPDLCIKAHTVPSDWCYDFLETG